MINTHTNLTTYVFSGLGAMAAVACLMMVTACDEGKVVESDFPAALMYNGQPIDPLCFDSSPGEDSSGTVDVTTCRPDNIIVTGEISPRQPDAKTRVVGVEYSFRDSGHTMRGPFVQYEPLGAVRIGDRDGYAVAITASGGGTGVFSAVRVVRLDGKNLVTMKTLGGGDRCNGGLAEATVRDGSIYQSLHATPYDLVTVGNMSQPPFRAYDDLDACAACCAGVVTYRGEDLVGIRLTADAVPLEDSPDKPLQNCFNAMARALQDEGKLEFSGDDLPGLQRRFSADCLPPPGQGPE